MVIEELRKDGIASLTGEGDITGFQRAAHTLSGNRRRISGVVHPPCAIIIVQVVIRFMRTDSNRGAIIFMSCHGYAWLEVHAPAWAQKKIDPAGRSSVQESAWVRWRQAAHHWTTVVTLQ